jgi:hypothetical protein
MRPISIEEVDQDMKEMLVGKVSGPNVFTTNFFHHYLANGSGGGLATGGGISL